MQLNLKVQNKSIWMLIITACLVYCTVAIVNHYFFRTYALDLGLYTHALYEYSHGRMATTQLFLESNNLLLSDHFDLYLIFLSPLVYIFNDYTLLVVQIIALLFGAFGIYKLLDSSEDTKSYSWLGTFIFLFSFGVFGAVSFEYHSNVLSVCFIPWWLLAVHSRKTLLAFIWLIVLFIGKENFSFFIFFLCLALLWRNRSDKFLRKIFIVSAGISLIYFLTIIKWVMPSLAGGGEFVHFGKYPVLGGSMGDALTFMINHPIEFLKIFFINHLNGYPELNSEKLFFYIVLFFAGGWAMLLRPYYLIAIAPLLLQKMFTNQFTTWGTSYQYNIEFVPILVLAVADGLKFLKLKFVWLIKWERAIVIKLILLTVSSSMYAMVERTQDYEKARVIFWQRRHFMKEYDLSEVKNVMQKIPEDAAVMATSAFMPHLACRTKVYAFPLIKDSEYILLSGRESSYPLTAEDYEDFVARIFNDPKWELIVQNNVVVLFKRRNS